jgi:hypothetical protein
MMAKAARYGRPFTHRKNETLRQYTLRLRDAGFWNDDITKEGLLVWLDTYEAVRFGEVELTEREFLTSMKLIFFLLTEMKVPEHTEYQRPEPVASSLSSAYSLESESLSSGDSESIPLSRTQSLRQNMTESERIRSNLHVLRQMETLLATPRKSVDSESLSSVIDHGSAFEEVIDREERYRRMRGGRLGEREGSVIYYDID